MTKKNDKSNIDKKKDKQYNLFFIINYNDGTIVIICNIKNWR